MIMLLCTLSVYSDFLVLWYCAMLHCTLSVYSDCCIRVFAIFLLAIGLHLFPKVRVIERHGCMGSTWLSTHRMEGIRPSARGCHKPMLSASHTRL